MKLRVVGAESLGAGRPVSYESTAATATDSHFPVHGYLPAPVRSLLPWRPRRWGAGIVAGTLGDWARVGRH
jgi:hypothetical protein